MELGALDEERRAVLAEVDRFAARAIEPRAARAERAIEAAELAAWMAQARAIGIAPGEAPSGFAPWEPRAMEAGDAVTGEDVDALSTVRILTRLARGNAGFALAVHLDALARSIARAVGVAIDGTACVALHGRIGLGRLALARLLAGGALDDEDRAIARDVYAPGARRIVTAPADVAWLLAPVIDDAGALRWTATRRDAADVQIHAHAHGFDELTTFSFRATGDVVRDGDAAEDARHVGLSLARMAVGLVAIALGAAQRAHALARRFAATRRQGGATIDRHAAVQLLLASSRQALDAIEGQLDSIARAEARLATWLPRALALRAEAHPLLCRAANDAMQVFGGIGYMRETGVEKAVRDLNHLRVTCGSPPDLALFVAEWERLHA